MMPGGECVVCGSTLDPHQCLTEEQHRERALQAFDAQGFIAKRARQEGYIAGLEKAIEIVDGCDAVEEADYELATLLGSAQADLAVMK